MGTLHHRVKDFPKKVMNSTLRKGDMISHQEQMSIIVLKRTDICDVRLLFTKLNQKWLMCRIIGNLKNLNF